MAWTHEQIHNARIIIAVGRDLGASSRDIQIALMTALTESNLHNYKGGDRDSVGLFQQRDAWGTYEQRHDPAAAARMFFQGGHAGQRGLFDFKNRNQMTMGQAAQAVQVSAFPERYAEHEHDAANLMQFHTPFGDINLPIPTGGGGGGGHDGPTAHDFQQNKDEAHNVFADPRFATQAAPTEDFLKPAVEQTNSGTAGVGSYAAPMALADLPNDQVDLPPQLQGGGFDLSGPGGGGHGGGGGAGAEHWRQQVRKIAKRYLGTPYVWGGTTPNGFDCSGFVQYVYKQMGVNLPRISYQQANYGRHISLDNLKVGDLVGWDNSSRNHGADHIAIYIGHGMIIEAPRPGASVQLSHLYDQNIAWGVRMTGVGHA